MDVQDLKEKIINDDKIEEILERLEMHHIKDRDEYYQCGMPDGDNPKSTIVYKDSLHVDAYTRDIKDPYGQTDIISLVSFINDTYFSESVKWLCDVCGYDFYGKEQPVSKFASWIKDMWKVVKEGQDLDDEKIEPISEKILDYFGKYGNPLFHKDGISYETQWEFELGYDLNFHMITIPIRDELGQLIGIKGRLFKEKIEEWESKYLYIQPCAKNKVLYGLHKTKPYIREANEVIIVESEKAVQQLWSLGVRNAVAIGGHILSDVQVRKLTHLNVPVTIAYDESAELGKDGKVDPDFYKNEFNKFLDTQTVYCIYDKNKSILNPKESPSDDPNKWEKLYSEYKFKVRG